MTKSRYVPDVRDIVWLDPEPQISGHEQDGHRPALVLTSREYNKQTGLMICCPLTTRIRNLPLEVQIPEEILGKNGVILIQQVKAVDFTARNVRHICVAPHSVLKEVKEKLAAILEID